MSSDKTYTIRPAGRHILTIGRDLIQDYHAAVVELVKNAYDADAKNVKVEFHGKSDGSGYSIVIEDDGHGMSRDTVINKWMVPSTPDKQDRKKSPSGRTMQGRKGVGRYAASILGKDLLLETVSRHGEKTTILVVWDEFEKAEYMDSVKIPIETSEVSEPSGTRLTIDGDDEFLKGWDQKCSEKLQFELKKLLSPVSEVASDESGGNRFCIRLCIEGFESVAGIYEKIKPYPLFDLFDYRITGKIGSDGKGTLEYVLQKVKSSPKEVIQFDAGETNCGELIFDIRVYDRDKEAIDSLARGLKEELGNYVGKSEVRRILNKYNGIGVYREGFRIRPLGDAEFDWLKLNAQRVQNPSMRIGSDQVIGYVQIQSEDISGLQEKSARDGLRENTAFSRLKSITKEVIAQLEQRRFLYRKKAGLGRQTGKVGEKLENLFSFDALKKDIRLKLTEEEVSLGATQQIIEIIDRDAESRNKLADEIHQAIAIYQGQATLGKIINVILHEGRRPLHHFRNAIPSLEHWYGEYLKTKDVTHLEKCLSTIKNIGQNAEDFVKLFRRLDPLAAAKRSARKQLQLKKVIGDSLAVFEEEMKTHHIAVTVSGDDDFRFLSWRQDIYAIFTNLADNSIYWMTQKKNGQRKITIELVTDNESLSYIDYRDTGPGIDPDLIESEVIFEPEFSTKPFGTGLGLAIAGEAATRNSLKLKVIEDEQGAWFRLQPKTEDAQNGV